MRVQTVLCILPLRAMHAIHQVTTRTCSASHLFDVLTCLIWVMACVALCHVRAGSIYFWLKDITPEFLKIHALYYALDVLQKVRACHRHS
jgi:hypothetical protein